MIDLITGVERLKLSSMDGRTPPPGDRPDELGAWNGDAEAVAAALRDRIAGEVRFDEGSRALYATDASNYRQVPIGVVVPRSVDDVIATVEVARAYGAPILARGGGTSLAGECCNVAIVIDFSKYLNRVLEVNVEERWARVEPGLVLDELRKHVAQYGLTFGPDPATHTHNTLGGMIGNNSCGMHAQMAGKAEENIFELDILTYDGVRMSVGPTPDDKLDELCGRADRVGEIYRGLRSIRDRYAGKIRERFPDIPRRVSGYPLQELLPDNGFDVARSLVGTECTCAVVLSAKVKLIPNPDQRVVLVLGFPDVYTAGDAVPEVNKHEPIALEGLDEKLIDFMNAKQLNTKDEYLLAWADGKAKGWLMCEFGRVGDKDGAIAMAKRCEEDLRAKGAIDSKLLIDEDDQKKLWEVRESGLGATAKIPDRPPFHPGWEDSAVPPDRVGRYLRDLRALYDKYGYDAALYGHFGQGCIHCRVDFNLRDAAGVEQFKRFMNEAAHVIRHYGGSLSGEHGDGQARAEYLPIMYGEEIVQAFREFKRVWDPQGKMNPGKVVDPYPVDSNLREGPYYRPWDPQTYFSFEPDDRGSFAFAANRCVGVGKCRRHEHGTMCPSYRVTREEKHATRGRARLLFEMLEGDPLHDGWHSEAVKEALDLCLACKGCKGDCPVNVDMATYKAEFLAHYYEGKRRPVWAYAFGLIMYWAHLGAKVPRLVNAVAQTPGLSAVAKAVVRMAPQRSIPPFARQSFKDWYARHRGSARPNAGKPRVILWPDTFNNSFHSTTAQHALEVLEAAGYDVIVPPQQLCCGRPLYDYGMLGLAKVFLRQIVETLRPEIEAGTPIVGLEPSCVSVFRDELRNMLPHDQDAQRLSKLVKMFGAFLVEEDWTPPRLERKATVHGHCHQKSLLGMQPERTLLERMGVDATWLDDGCCGMAGAFGFEAGEHYDVSVKCGELGYLPHVRETDEDALIIAEGFSCREQAMQMTEREPLHLADVLWLALRHGPKGPPGARPELAAMPSRGSVQKRARLDAALAALAFVGAGAGAFAVISRNRGGR
ncbi:MAG TPA: FAD-binding and (Fe-S)-binding domain-containing protein [Candidatus Acidoferrum sp.]|nr:FAD-binding and (Fe-S)-binding domain-containing protein [Candidatus Acidoferrum sp.]